MGRAGDRELTLRRERLLVRSAELRVRFAQEAQVLVTPLAVADRTVAAVQWLRRNPQWPLGVLVLWIVMRPRRVLRLAARLRWFWGLARQARRMLTLAPLLHL